MTDIMKLADDYAVAQGDARADLGANAGMDEQDPMWVAMKKARAALQSAIDALQATVTVREGQANHWQEIAQQAQAERDQLQADLKAELDGNASLREQHGAKDNETMHSFIARVVAERDALQAKLDELQRQEADWFHAECDDPDYSGFYQSEADAITQVNEHGGYVTPLFATPKALEPLTDEQIDQVALEQTGFDGYGTQPLYNTDIRRIVRAAEKHHGITKGTPT